MAKKDVSVESSAFSAELLKATGEQALEAVHKVGADEQADLVEAWVAAGNIDAVARVANEDEAPAPARKAARRGLNVLKSRGIRVPEASTKAKPFATKTETIVEGRFIPTDGSGNATLAIFSRTTGKDPRLAEVLYNDGLGILRVTGGSVPASRIREWENESRRGRGFAPVPVSAEWVRWRVAALREANARSGNLIPLEIERFADLLTPVPATEPAHPVASLTSAEISGTETRVALSASLHAEPEFRAFLVSREMLAEVLRRVGERVAEVTNQPSQEQVNPLLEEELSAATDRFFEPEVRKQLADRMLDAAVSIQKRVGDERALDVIAVRAAVLNAGLITQPPREIPFLRGFFDKSLAILAAQSAGQVNIPIPNRQSAGPVLSADQLAAIEAAKGAAPATSDDEKAEGLSSLARGALGHGCFHREANTRRAR